MNFTVESLDRLHFGCFNCPLEGWLNTDVTPHIHVAKIPGLARLMHRMGRMTDTRFAEHRAGVFAKVHYLDVTKRWGFADQSFRAIYSSHVLEHLTLRGARKCLAEAFRCVKPGGVLRIAVPDLDAHISEYRSEDAAAWATRFFEANESVEKNMHHYMYNFHSLRDMMLEAGFRKVERRRFADGECPDVERLDNRPESLFVEAKAG